MSATVTWQQMTLPIFDPVEPRVMPQDPAAFFTLNWLSPRGKLNRQKAFNLDEMETVIRLTAGQPNLYMSQCTLDRPVRRSPFVMHGTHAFVDLDTYRVPAIATLSEDAMTSAIRAHCNDNDTPVPSAIIRSGNGYYCKWYWTNPAGRPDVGRMIGVNRALVHKLDRLGADPKAVDCTRVLRVTGTEHTGAKRMVELLHLEQQDGRTITYNFNDIAGQLAFNVSVEPDLDHQQLDEEPASLLAVERAAHKGTAVRFTREGWFWAIVEDCRTLAALRWRRQPVPIGWRDVFGHITACALARIFEPRDLYREIQAHTRLILPGDYVEHDLAGHCSTLLDLARRSAAYRYSKARLIDALQIRPDEERHMVALISDNEKERRRLAKRLEQRRAAGMIARAEYEAAALTRDRPWEFEGLTRRTWYRRRSEWHRSGP